MISSPHRQFADRAINRLQNDPRVLGLAACGSWPTGELDEFSGLDLVLVAEPGRYKSLLQDLRAIALSLGACLASFPEEHNGHTGRLVCLFEDPLLGVSLKAVDLDELPLRSENPLVLWERGRALTKAIEEHKPVVPHIDLQWIEDRFWVWLHRGSALLGRGEIFSALSLLAFLREQALGPLLNARAGRKPHGVRRIERSCDASGVEELRTTVCAYDAHDCEQALKAAAKMYVGLRETLDSGTLQRNRRAEMASLRYLHAVGEKLRGGV